MLLKDSFVGTKIVPQNPFQGVGMSYGELAPSFMSGPLRTSIIGLSEYSLEFKFLFSGRY